MGNLIQTERFRGHKIEILRTGWFAMWLDGVGMYKADTLSGACEIIRDWERGALPEQRGRKPSPETRQLYNVRNSTIDYDEVLEREAFEEEEWEEET